MSQSRMAGSPSMDGWWMTQGPQSSLCASRCDGSSNVAEQGRPSGHPWMGGGPLGQCFLVPATGTGLLILANVEKVSQLKICPLCLPTAGANALDAMCCAKNKKFLFPRRFPPPKAAAGLQQGALSSPVQFPTRAGNSQDMRPQVEYGVELSGKLVLNPISAQKTLNFIVFCQINLNHSE